MGDLCLRAIETNENIDKVVNDGFAPAIIKDTEQNTDVYAKIEMRKLKRILRKNTTNQNILVKIKNNSKYYKVSNLIQNEITGVVSLIEFDSVKYENTIKTKVPIVFNYSDNRLKNSLHVNLSEIEIIGHKNKIPDYFSINVGKNKTIRICNLQINSDLKLLQDSDTIIAEIY
jgi:hypothetical protein